MLNNMTTLVFDPSRMGTADALPDEIERWPAGCAPRRPRPADPISLPGEPERRVAERRNREGVRCPRARCNNSPTRHGCSISPVPCKGTTT